jgi:hypothetical protein
MKYYLLTFIFFIFSCKSEKNWDIIIFESLQKLSADQIVVDIEVDGVPYFDKNEDFKASVLLNQMACQLEFINENLGKFNLRVEEADWSKATSKRIKFKHGVPEANDLSGSLLIGKSINVIQEGFVLFNGSVEIKQLNQNACVIVIDGELKKPENDNASKPINGVIVWKLPKELSSNPNWKEFYF